MDVAEIDLGDADVAVVVGPTASGKTDLAIALAEARGGEIIGADSVQVYRYFDIGSGKPSLEDRARVPHHLVDAIDPMEPLDAASYASRGAAAIDDVRRRGKLPVVCGGTFLWVRALLYGLSNAPSGDAAIRQKHAELAEKEGRAVLHAELAQVDPDAAAKLDPNDFVRVSRALEVFELTGRPLSALHREHGFREPRYKARLVGIGWTADELVERIVRRTDRMLEMGWEGEVSDLVARGYRDARAMSSVGYRQVLDYIEGRLPREELATSISRATKIFARRQRTWLREEPVLWLDRR
ncbi:MAG: tRNA (adenosine(37)-N6)-dimethylallyltransferase MiaA [Polyangiaceae bacterium]